MILIKEEEKQRIKSLYNLTEESNIITKLKNRFPFLNELPKVANSSDISDIVDNASIYSPEIKNQKSEIIKKYKEFTEKSDTQKINIINQLISKFQLKEQSEEFVSPNFIGDLSIIAFLTFLFLSHMESKTTKDFNFYNQENYIWKAYIDPNTNKPIMSLKKDNSKYILEFIGGYSYRRDGKVVFENLSQVHNFIVDYFELKKRARSSEKQLVHELPDSAKLLTHVNKTIEIQDKYGVSQQLTDKWVKGIQKSL